MSKAEYKMNIKQIIIVVIIAVIFTVLTMQVYRDLNDHHTATDNNGHVVADGARKNGYRVLYSDDGTVKLAGMVKDGVPIGIWRRYDSEGNVVQEINQTKESYNPHRNKVTE